MADSGSGVHYRKAEVSDVGAIAEFGKRTFYETFFVPCGYTEADIQTYFATDYSDEKVQGWIEDPKKHVSLAIETSSYAIAGYLVIDGPTELPHKDVHEKSPELKKLYVDEKFKGKGIAKTLMETGLRWLNTEDCPYEGDLFISVFSENHRGQKFYQKYGAEKIGEYLYPVGDVMDKEEVWRISRGLIAQLGKEE
tara:strand:- start:26 stop:610 length:585 start_codon:yes stop_codon:yes gene_type:complete